MNTSATEVQFVSGPRSGSTEPMHIRAYSETDYHACRKLWVELTEHHRHIYESPTIGGDDPGGGFDDFLARPDFVAAWVAVVPADVVVGLSGLLVRGSEGEIEPVIVRAENRGKGVGRALIEHGIQEARARRLTSLSIRPVARNREAIAAFVKLGFRTVGHLELFQSLEARENAERWRSGITIHGVELDY